MSPLALSLRFLQTQPDGRLLALAGDGHERAFEALVRRYRSALLAYCRRVAPGGTSPEDILQQALLQAWRAVSAGNEVHDARAWLYRIVHNVAISTLRAAGELPDGVYPAPGAIGVDQLVEQRLDARAALAGLAALPEPQRQVMLSTALDGQSHEEVAAALGLSSGSVRGLIYRARATLRAAAAAVIPAPLIDWAVRHPGRPGRSAAIYETVAGGGSAGLAGAGSSGLIGGASAPLGGLILKGGAIVAAGALAGAGAIVATRQSHHRRGGASIAGHATHSPGINLAAAARPADTPAGGHSAAVALGLGAGASRGARARGRFGGAAVLGFNPTGRRHDGSGGDGSPAAGGGAGSGAGGHSDGGGSPSGHDGSGGRFDGSRGGSGGGSDGGSGGGSGGGSDGGGSGGSSGGGEAGATTATTGSDGGSSSSGGSDGGSSGGSDGGSSGSGGGGTSTSSSSSDGGDTSISPPASTSTTPLGGE